MADIEELLPPKRKPRVTRFPHGQPRDPDKLVEIARLKEIKKLPWREIGKMIGISGQGACLLYNHWKQLGWEFKKEDEDELVQEYSISPEQ